MALLYRRTLNTISYFLMTLLGIFILLYWLTGTGSSRCSGKSTTSLVSNLSSLCGRHWHAVDKLGTISTDDVSFLKQIQLNIQELRDLLQNIYSKQTNNSETMIGISRELRRSRNSQEFNENTQVIKALLRNITSSKIFKNKSSNKYIVIDDVNINPNVTHRLVVMVTSNAPNFLQRQSIRRLWGNSNLWKTKETFKVIFVLGGTKNRSTLSKITVESSTYRDLILETVPEDYYNLANKLAIGLHWISENSNADFEYVLKCDDDVFVHLDNVMNALVLASAENVQYFGQAMFQQPVERHGRYKLSKEERESDVYDPYCSGGGFIITSNLLAKVSPHLDFVSPLKYEDAYFGTVVFKYAPGVVPVNHPGFDMRNVDCKYHEEMLVSHPSDVNCMNRLLQQNFKQTFQR